MTDHIRNEIAAWVDSEYGNCPVSASELLALIDAQATEIKQLRAELAKPEPWFADLIARPEVPAQELAAMDAHAAWHDAPTCAGWWMCLYRGELSTAIFNEYEIENFDAGQMAECRWYGPISQDPESKL